MRVTKTSLAILIGLPLFGSAPARAATPEPLRVVGLRTEYMENPLGMDSRKPRLSWRLQSGGRGVTQSAYEVRVAGSERGVRGGSDSVWSSGRVASDDSIQLAFQSDGSSRPISNQAGSLHAVGLPAPSHTRTCQ